MIPAILLTILDPSLGRLDFASLSDQTSMEMLTSKLTEDTLAWFRDENGSFLDTCEWDGVTCDDAHNVTCLEYNGYALELHGELSLSYLPNKIEECIITNNYVWGTIQTGCLPHTLKLLDLSANDSMTGTVDQGNPTSDGFHQFDGIDQKITRNKLERGKIDGMAKVFHQ